MYLIPAWPAVAVVFVVSAFLCRALALRDGRNPVTYFCLGLFLGPLALFVAMMPIPEARRGASADGQSRLRVVHGRKCPECKKDAGVRPVHCPYCGYSFEEAWWDETKPPIASHS